MKIIIFSDSHGYTENMRKVLSMHRNADYIIHLGDGRGDVDWLRSETDIPVISVSGNCDGIFGAAKELPYASVDLDIVRLFICHGHTYYVKSTLDYLGMNAINNGADVALFGHTHEAYSEYIPPKKDGEKPLWLFNPGSISLPNDGRPSFGILEAVKKSDGRVDLLLSHGNV